MPTYRFTGGFPRALLGLTEGVNAHRDGTPPGATIEAQPGDTIRTDAPYPHPELVEVDGPQFDASGALPSGIQTVTNTSGADIPITGVPTQPEPEAVPIQLTADEVAHLSPEVLNAIHQAEAQATDHQEQ